LFQFKHYDSERGRDAADSFSPGRKAVPRHPPGNRKPAGYRRTPDDLEVNDRIVHANFGKGTVREVSGEIATIAFDDDKIMKFMLKYTPIRKEEDDGDRQ